jgi:alkaline phosphatase D
MKRDVRADRSFDQLVREGRLSRRALLRAAVALAAAPLVVPRSVRAQVPVSFDGHPFTLGVASGHPAAEGISLWTRLAPRPLSPDGGMAVDAVVPVNWQVAEDERFSRGLREGMALANPEFAHSVHVDVGGLAPGRWYFYRFMAGGETSAVGRTRTADAADSTPSKLRFAVASCQHYEQGYYAAWRHALREDLDLVCFVGDYIYEGSWGVNKVRRFAPAHEARTLDDYRVRHAQARTDRDLQRIHASVPFLLTWDDHEVDNDYAGDQQEALDPRFLERRAAGYQAYFEHMPLPWKMRPRTDGSMPIATHVDFGTLARFVVVDDRQYRSPQACQLPGRGGSRDIPADCAELLEPGRTLLGEAQTQWLEARMGDTRAQWNVLVQQSMFMGTDNSPGPERSVWSDAWDGYPASRQRVMDAWRRHAVRNPVVVGGDIHATVVGGVPGNPQQRDSAPVASEFCCTSISSEGRPQAYWDAKRPDNPQVLFGNSERRGYITIELDAKRLTAHARGLSDVLREDSQMNTLASFVVEDGRAGPQKI